VTVDNIESKVLAWLEQIRPYNQHEMQMNVAASALLVIDMQRFFFDATSPTYTCGGVAILPTVKRLMDSFRRAGRPVIFTRQPPARWPARLRGSEPARERHEWDAPLRRRAGRRPAGDAGPLWAATSEESGGFHGGSLASGAGHPHACQGLDHNGRDRYPTAIIATDPKVPERRR
jgi:hypothetical protein